MIKFDINKKYYFFLFLLIYFHILFSLSWIVKNEFPAGHDEPTHIGNFIKFRNNLSSELNWREKAVNTIFTDVDYPPLFYSVSNLFTSFTEVDFKKLELISVLFFLLSIILVFKIGEYIKDKHLGISAAIIYSFYPEMFHYSRVFNLDVFFTFMVSLLLLWLLKIDLDKFQNRKNIFLFGVLLGLGMLSKQCFPVFILGPVFILIFQLCRQKRCSRKVIFNLAVCFLIAVLISMVFYSGYLLLSKRGSNILYRMKLIDDIGWYPKTKLMNYFYYIYCLIFEQISPFNFIIFIIGFAIFITSRSNKKLFLILWILIPLIVFSGIPSKYDRYTMAYLPAAALMSGYAFSRKKTGIFFLIIVTIFNVYQYYWTSFASVPAKFNKIVTKLRYLPHKDVDNVFGLLDRLKEEFGRKEMIIGVITNMRGGIFLDIFNASKLRNYNYRWVPFLYYDNIHTFIKNIGGMDAIIYINNSGPAQDWPDSKSINKSIEDMNFAKLDSKTYLYISADEIEDIVFLKEKLVFRGTIPLSRGNYYIYSR